MDTVIGKKVTKIACMVFTERKTKQEIRYKIASKSQYCIVKELDKIERKLGSKKFRETFKSINCDNGCENLDFERIERSVITKSKKNRRFIQKGSDIGKFSPEKIKMIEHWMNNYP